MRARRLALACIVVFAGSLASRAEASEGGTAPEADAEIEARTRGLRLQLGVFALAHTKRAPGASFTLAPGFSVGGAYRFGVWEIEATIRGAKISSEMGDGNEPLRGGGGPPDDFSSTTTRDSRLTELLAGGGGIRWFASRTASTAFYAGLGAEYMHFYWERSGCCHDRLDRDGAGLAFRTSAGVELLHDNAHGRVAIDMTATFPTARFHVTPSDAVYVVPITFGARVGF